MSAMYVVLPLAILVVSAFLASFIWATRSGQLDDLDTPAQRMLWDNDDQ